MRVNGGRTSHVMKAILPRSVPAIPRAANHAARAAANHRKFGNGRSTISSVAVSVSSFPPASRTRSVTVYAPRPHHPENVAVRPYTVRLVPPDSIVQVKLPVAGKPGSLSVERRGAGGAGPPPQARAGAPLPPAG